jgi:hypothetical protein
MKIEQRTQHDCKDIKDVAEKTLHDYITVCEAAFGKDEMTDGEKPIREMLKAILKAQASELPNPESWNIDKLAENFKKGR